MGVVQNDNSHFFRKNYNNIYLDISMLYSFLLEDFSDQSRVMGPRAIEPSLHIHDMSLSSAVKPLSIGSRSTLLTVPAFILKKKIDYHLIRLGNLQKNIQAQASNPKNANKAELYKTELQIAQQAYQVHHEYFTKILYWKTKISPALFNIGAISRLYNQYERKLFMLSQSYQRVRLGIQTANTSNY